MNINALVEDFTLKLTSLIAQQVAERAGAALAEAVGTVPARRGRPPKAAALTVGRPRAATNPKVAQSRRLQGQYLGALRRLKGANRARVRQLAQEKGVAEALKLATKLSAA